MANRACDSCKRRKIKCDGSPTECSNCRISNLTCSYSILPKKRGPKPNSVRRRRARDVVDSSPSSPRTIQTSPAHKPGVSVEETKLPAGEWSSFDIHPSLRSPCFSNPTPSSDSVNTPGYLSSTNVLGIATWPNSHIPDARDAAGDIYNSLVAAICAAVPNKSPRQLVDDCISRHLQFTFPVAPIYHEPTVRRNAARFFSGSAFAAPNSMNPFAADTAPKEHLASLRAFTHITGLCASTANSPENLAAIPASVATSFLRASRACLKLYEDYDIEHPHYYSIIIHIYHSAALHGSGRTMHSWHELGQAIIIAQSMRLHDERSRARYAANPLEAQLLRFIYWSLYMINRSAAVLNNRPILLRHSISDLPPEIPFLVPDRIPLLDPTSVYSAPPFEERVLYGADLCRRIWTTAADLIEGIQACAIQNRDERARAVAVADLMCTYVAFAGILDDLPTWLQSPDSILTDGATDTAIALYQRGSFWRLRVDAVVTFHCLRMVLLKRCAENGLVTILGLSDEPLMIAMRTAEIARDCLDVVDSIPFEYLQTNGEPLMEKLRQIGSALLELSQKTEFEMIKTRAKAYLARLLNILARLGSRAVDELNIDPAE